MSSIDGLSQRGPFADDYSVGESPFSSSSLARDWFTSGHRISSAGSSVNAGTEMTGREYILTQINRRLDQYLMFNRTWQSPTNRSLDATTEATINISVFRQILGETSNFLLTPDFTSITVRSLFSPPLSSSSSLFCPSSSADRPPCNVVKHIAASNIGHGRHQVPKLNRLYGLNRLLSNNILQEKQFTLGDLNKIFCAQWLSDRTLVCGTKCNKLIILDTHSGKIVQIPSLRSSQERYPSDNTCGIHSVVINPSRTLLATGGENSNDIAIYKLPTFDPVCVGEGAHTDWIFDLSWLDDEFLVSGSRDTTLSLWRVDDKARDIAESKVDSYTKSYSMSPVAIARCEKAEKIRATLFNNKVFEIVALSLNAFLHVFDAQTMKQKSSSELPHQSENVCLAQEMNHGCYAVGSKSNITLVDYRTLSTSTNIAAKPPGCGIRSLSFLDNLLTIGTGVGSVQFYDIRAQKYFNDHKHRPAILRASNGWVHRDEHFEDAFLNHDYTPAIYTHEYDATGTRLFTAGGPLPASLHGNYAGLWH